MTKRLRPDQFPPWYDGQSINEAAFCREFLASHKLLYAENSFFTPEGRMTDVAPLKTEIYQIIEHSNNLTNLVGRRVWGFTGIESVLKLPLRTADGWQRDYSDDNPFV